MAHIQTLHLTHLPSNIALHVALYQDLKNGAFLRKQLLDGNSEFEYALIDASMVNSNILFLTLNANQHRLLRLFLLCTF